MPLNTIIRKQILQRDNFKCRCCKSREDLHVHHILYRSYGGSDTLENLVTLCNACHKKVHDTDGRVKLVILAKSGNPDDTPDASKGLKFKVVKVGNSNARSAPSGKDSSYESHSGKVAGRAPRRGNSKASGNDGESHTDEAVGRNAPKLGEGSVPDGFEPVDTTTPLTPHTHFRVEALARYSKTYKGYVDLGNYRDYSLAQKRLREITAEGYRNARIKRVELD